PIYKDKIIQNHLTVQMYDYSTCADRYIMTICIEKVTNNGKRYQNNICIPTSQTKTQTYAEIVPENNHVVRPVNKHVSVLKRVINGLNLIRVISETPPNYFSF
ncbi:MAG: hypothetical protein NC406_07965, partial [Bacteroides sp.]|nr:hypothetical protein [Bacteroides sp.]MCM1095769.1 hypothetical protein [Terasakiella sp.]